MLCEKCKLNPAVVHIVKIVNGKKTTLNLCEQCSKAYEEMIFGANQNKKINEIIANILNLNDQFVKEEQKETIKCERCGLTLEEFKKVGRLGCSQCYSTFDEQLRNIIDNVQVKSIHTGKIPRRDGLELKKKNEVLKLKRELEDRVSREEFEEAAAIRDQIKEIENMI